MMEKRKPLLSLRPRFDPGLAVAESIPATLVAMAAVTMLAGTFVYIIFSFIGLGRWITGGTIYTVFFFLSLTLTPAVFYELKRRALARTAYHFYDTYLEFQNFRFYINRRRARVRYEDIADVTQNANFLQGLKSLTTVYIYVPSLGYQTQARFSGVKMGDIAEDANVTGRIIDLIEKGPASMAAASPPVPALGPSMRESPAAYRG